jgi:hypothetical protein
VENSVPSILESGDATERPPKWLWYTRLMFNTARLLCGIAAIVAIASSAIFLFLGFLDVMSGTKSYDFPVGIGLVVAAYLLWKITWMHLPPHRAKG